MNDTKRPEAHPEHVVCPFDQRAGLLVGFARDGSGRPPYRIVRCGEHALEWVDAPPGLDVGDIEDALDVLYGPADGEPDEAGRSRVARLLNVVERVVEPPGVLHDHGCGNGQLLQEAVLRGWSAQGNDLVARPRAALEARGIRYYQGPLSAVTIDRPADVVTSYCVIPHVTDPVTELMAIRGMLRPGGWLVAEMPSNGVFRRVARWLYRLSGARWQWVLGQIYQPGAHRWGFNPASARHAFERAGFGQVEVVPFSHDPQHSLKRFTDRPLWLRGAIWVAVSTLARFTRLPGGANHLVVLGKR